MIAESASIDIHARTDPSIGTELLSNTKPAGPLAVTHGPTRSTTTIRPMRRRRWLPTKSATGTSDHATRIAVWSRSQPSPTTTSNSPTEQMTRRRRPRSSLQRITNHAAPAMRSHMSDSRMIVDECSSAEGSNATTRPATSAHWADMNFPAIRVTT